MAYFGCMQLKLKALSMLEKLIELDFDSEQHSFNSASLRDCYRAFFTQLLPRIEEFLGLDAVSSPTATAFNQEPHQQQQQQQQQASAGYSEQNSRARFLRTESLGECVRVLRICDPGEVSQTEFLESKARK